ncbi:transposase [Streptomyces sp. NPDC090741]|uniref:transposase n=1 Tax=Streptomyces sp. NPDC090741 TaxID=3365967 RepID=UPI0038161D27
MPGVGVRNGVGILIEVGDGGTFPTASHLAAYAGRAPETRSSGSSIRGEQPSSRGPALPRPMTGRPPLRHAPRPAASG